MLKYLLLALAIYVIYRIWKKRNQLPAAKFEPRPAEPEKMLSCSLCGVNFPESDAVFESGKVFCSTSHRDKAIRG